MKFSTTLILLCAAKFALHITTAVPTPQCIKETKELRALYVQMYNDNDLGTSTVGQCFSGPARVRIDAKFGCALASEECEECVPVAEIEKSLADCEDEVAHLS